MRQVDIVWQPQPGPQKALVDCPIGEIFYGGARGSAKTDGVLGKYALKAQRYGRHFNAVFFRKEMPMLDDAIERSLEIYGALGWKWNDQKKTWKTPQGGRLRFRPLENIADTEKYQGQNITDICVEEAGNYPDPRPIDRMNGVLRSVHGVPAQLILTGNPGGPGQHWIRKRYVDPAPKGMKLLHRDLPNGKKHAYIFIPGKIRDNQLLLQKDPDYINRLYMVGSKELVRAWLEGDFGAIEGAYFEEWDGISHVISPFQPPEHWTRLRSMDWGSAKPFDVQWFVIAGEDYLTPDKNWIPKGAMVCYREWYGAKADMDGTSLPNVGLKLPAEEVGQGIWEREKNDPEISYGVIDPAAFSEDGGPSIAHRIMKSTDWKVIFRRADNKRVAKVGPMGGWDQLRARLRGEEFGDPMGHRPMIFWFDTCEDLIRTLPALQHDPNRAEDLDTNAEDHAADCARYAVMSRPWIQEVPVEIPPETDIWGNPKREENSWKTIL